MHSVARMAMEPSSSGNEEQQQQQQETKASQLLAQHALQERHHLKPPDQVVACPRCQSLNTKFCYYNNYSLTQPRHFCKNCRRYWTAGGTLRNVPFGGGCRKNKRAKHRNMDGQSSSGTENSETDHSMAAAEQHTLLGSSSAGLFGSEDGMAFVTHQEGTWSQPQGTSHSGEGGLAFTQSCQGLRIGQHSQPFDSGIMSLGMFSSIRPDAGAALSMHNTSQQVHGGDLGAFFDNSPYGGAGALAALSEAHGSYDHTDGGDEASSYASGEVWGNLQHHPKQEVLWGQDQESIEGSLDIDRQQDKAKFPTPSLPPAQGLDDEETAAQPEAWQRSASQGGMSHYETSSDSSFWSNPGWPPGDLHVLHGSGET